MKKLLLLSIVFVVGCRNYAQPKTIIRDSIWPVLKDTIYSLDSSGMYYWGHTWDKTTHIHKRYEKTSDSQWYLIRIKDTGDNKEYKYIRNVAYSMITDGGFDDLVGRFERQYFTTSKFLKQSSTKDTIPEKLSMIILDDSLKRWTFRSDFYIGGLFGEYQYSRIDSIVPFEKPHK